MSERPAWSGLAPLLLATEHTEHDAGAEAVAFALALRRGALPLATVLPLARDAELEMAAPAAAERADGKAAARREALIAAAAAAGVTLDLSLRRGPLQQTEIVDEARERRSGLLIIRRRGRRGLLAQLLVGEMVNRVLDHAPCSVLVTPREGVLWRRAVLAAVDAGYGADAADGEPPPLALPAVAAVLARECGASLHFVCAVATEAQRGAAERALAHAVRDSGEASASTEVRVGAAAAEIIAAAAARGADLLVVHRDDEPRGGLLRAQRPQRNRLGHIAHKVTGLAACPVLVHVPTTEPRSEPRGEPSREPGRDPGSEP